MTRIVIKEVNQEPKLVEFGGNVDDLHNVFGWKEIQFTPFELGECDLSIGFSPMHKTNGSIPNFFVYDKYDTINGNALIVKCSFNEKNNDYIIKDINEKEFKSIKKYMKEESYV